MKINTIERKLSLNSIVDLDKYPLDNSAFVNQCKHSIDADGCVVLPNFLRQDSIEKLIQESDLNQ